MADFTNQYAENKYMYQRLQENTKNNNLDWEKYLKTQLMTISNNISRFGNPMWDTIRGIPGGGAFTSKVDIRGFIIKSTDEHIQNLWNRIGYFIQLAEKFRNDKQPDYETDIKIYRSLEIGNFTEMELRSGNSCTNIYQFIGENNGVMPHPIPFSCSWNGSLAFEKWQQSNCCLLEINMPNNYPFVTTSLPEIEGKDLETELQKLRDRRIIPLNQEQFELVLAPGFLYPIDCRQEQMGDRYIFILECNIGQMTYDQIRSYFPEDQQHLLY